MNGLAICAGVGGIELALERRIAGFETVCYVEGELYSAANIVKKMETGRFHSAPVWSNLCTFDGKPWRKKVHLISGGFPCQPHSTAGKRLGKEDPRNLWPHVSRIIGEILPSVVFLENVPNINNTMGAEIVGDLAQMGYSSAWCVVTASSVGAPHKRARWFLLAHADSCPHKKPSRTHREIPLKGGGLQPGQDKGETWKKSGGGCADEIPNAHYSNKHAMPFNESFESPPELESRTFTDAHLHRWGQSPQNTKGRKTKRINCDGSKWDEFWEIKPRVGRVVDGVADWVDRMRACGNGVVPQQAAHAFDILAEVLGVFE